MLADRPKVEDATWRAVVAPAQRESIGGDFEVDY